MSPQEVRRGGLTLRARLKRIIWTMLQARRRRGRSPGPHRFGDGRSIPMLIAAAVFKAAI